MEGASAQAGDGGATAAAPAPLADRRQANAARRTVRAVARNPKAAIGLGILLVIAVVAAFPSLFTHTNPNLAIYAQDQPPTSAHPFGTTLVGQDVYAQVIYGTRLTLIITLVVGFVATLISVMVGITAAYVGGLTDRGLSLITDVFLIIPTLPLLIVLASYLPPGPTTIIVVLCLTSWAFQARQLRSQGLSIRNRDFLAAARVRGERRSYIIFVEILSTMVPLIAASFLGVAVYAVGFAAGLQFLGLGDSSQLTWGTILYNAQQNGALETGNPWWILAPGIAVALLGSGFALLNYAFDEVGNPALRPMRKARARADS